MTSTESVLAGPGEGHERAPAKRGGSRDPAGRDPAPDIGAESDQSRISTAGATREPLFIHFLAPKSIVIDRFGFGRVLEYGDEIEVTGQLIEDNTDRTGACFLDLLGNDEEQERRWGKVVFRRGRWPAGQSRLERGSFAWADAREAARKAAWTIENLATRQEALRKVEADFGPALPANKTVSHYAGDRHV
jgi:hypothetical protein